MDALTTAIYEKEALYAGFRLGSGLVSSGYLPARLARISNVLFHHGMRMFVSDKQESHDVCPGCKR